MNMKPTKNFSNLNKEELVNGYNEVMKAKESSKKPSEIKTLGRLALDLLSEIGYRNMIAKSRAKS